MIINQSCLSEYFENALHDLKCHRDTKSYIIGVYNKFRFASNDLSKDSLTLLYSNAKTNQDFETFQRISDYLLFAETLFPESLNSASHDYYYTIARASYYNCYRLVNRSWQVYENLADDFVPITSRLRSCLISR